MSTPLYDTLKAYAASAPLRFHMPGHKGKLLPLPELMGLAPLDVTELPSTGNLYTAGAPFNEAQRLWAEVFGFEFCQFLTGGSTMGIHTGLALCVQPGSRVLIDRGCHRAVFHALALLDLEPVWLERPWLTDENLTGPISPETLEQQMNQNPDIKTVCITSPTYAGMLSDVTEIASIVHAHGGKLFVDGAHGAHLPFLGLNPFSGADAVTVSAHKTLPAMGQSALLFSNGFAPDQVRQLASVFGTSSPSYPMMASMDAARDWLLSGEGQDAYRRTANHVTKLRNKFSSLGGDHALDPCRLTLRVKDGSGFAKQLEKRGVYPEMEDGGHVVLICTAQDSDEDFLCLEQILTELQAQMGDCSPITAPPLPQKILSPRQALFAPSETRILKDCEGKISASQIAPYPPGVPVVAPGEQITKKELAYFSQIGYNMLSEVRIVSR